MPRTKEAIDITPGTKTKEISIGSVKGVKLDNPIVATATWTVPTVDELVELLTNSPDSVLTEIATARMTVAVADARADAIDANEPREVKVQRLVDIAVKKFGMSEEAARAMAEANIPQ